MSLIIPEIPDRAVSFSSARRLSLDAKKFKMPINPQPKNTPAVKPSMPVSGMTTRPSTAGPTMTSSSLGVNTQPDTPRKDTVDRSQCMLTEESPRTSAPKPRTKKKVEPPPALDGA